ncbi:MAG: acyl carrier protein [Candidatus Omnitrophica bacterium]|nr:acyl carrier protein [Candidatus Omnitrophota bacterium]
MVLTASQIAEKARVTLSEELKVKVEEVLPEKKIAEDLGADSLQRIELVMKLEEAFGIKIPDDEAMRLVTVQDTIDFLQRHLSGNKPG